MTPRQQKIAVLVPGLLKWFSANARDLPWRRTTDPYPVFVSEIMLQQTQVATVLPYWSRWMQALPDLVALASASSETLHKLWEGLGYYRRVRNLQLAAKKIVEDHGGIFPQDYEAILELPGVGRYTAGAICSICFDQPKPILDGNVIRVLTRLFAISGDPGTKPVRDKLWQLATALVEEASLAAPRGGRFRPCSALNQALMELGALVCTPRDPRCADCPLMVSCTAHRLSSVTRFPALPTRRPLTPRTSTAFVLRRGDRFLVSQRPSGVINAHLWEFPSVEATPLHPELNRLVSDELGIVLPPLEPFCSLSHTITRYRIRLDVLRGSRPPRLTRTARTARGACWLTLVQLAELPFTAAHARIRERLLTSRGKRTDNQRSPDHF